MEKSQSNKENKEKSSNEKVQIFPIMKKNILVGPIILWPVA